ncbi:MAG: hypothetical protein WD077_05855 [Bacteroidia bacterium]
MRPPKNFLYAISFIEMSSINCLNNERKIYEICIEDLEELRQKLNFISLNDAYSYYVLERISKFNVFQKKEFIVYQFSLVENEKQWFLDLQSLLDKAQTFMGETYNPWENSLKGINEIMKEIYEEYFNIIEGKPNLKNKQIPSSTHSFTYLQYAVDPDKLANLYESLKFTHLIDAGTNLSNFNKVFSNKEIKTPTTWTGSISQLYYFIKLIHNDWKLIKNLKQEQWKVTCQCFVDADGNSFDRKKFRSMKKPVKTAHIIENAASHLK